MKKVYVALVATMAFGAGGATLAQASAHHSRVPSKVLSESASQRKASFADLQAKLAKFHGKKLTAVQLRSLGLRPAGSLAGHRLSTQKAKVADVGCTYWYTYHYAGFAWVNRDYCGPYYSYPWYPYYYLYDNFYLCNYANSGCAYTHEWYWQYYLYYYPNGTWYTYGPQGYNDSQYGPYSG